MTNRPGERTDRREFLRLLGRGAALGALAALTIWLARQSRAGAGPTGCPGHGYCDACGRLDRCRQDRARQTRNETRSRRP